MSPELGEGREERSLPMVEMTEGECHPELPPTVIPNAERDLIVMAVERQGERRDMSAEC